MAGVAIKPLFVDPQGQADMMSLQRRQALVDAIMQRSQQGPDTSGWNQMRITPRYPIGAGVSQLASALMASKLQKTLDQQYRDAMANQYSRLVGAFGGGQSQASQDDAQQPQPQASAPPQSNQPPYYLAANQDQANPPSARDDSPPTDPGQVSNSYGGNHNPPDISQSGDAQLQPMPPEQSGPSPVAKALAGRNRAASTGSPLNPFGLPPQTAAMLYMQDPNTYTGKLLESLGPTRDIRTLQQAGLSPTEINAAIRGKATKEGYIAPNVVNGVPLDPRTNLPVASVPNQETGLQQILTPQGWVTVKSQGYDAARAATAGATEAAQQGNRVINVEQAAGGTRPMWAGNVAGVAPAAAASGPQLASPANPYGQNFNAWPKQEPAANAANPPAPPKPAAAGGRPPIDPFADVPRILRPSGIGQTTDQGKYLAGIGEARNAKGQDLADKASSANIAINNIDTALGSLDKTNPGPLFDEINAVKGTLVQAGVPETVFQYGPSEGQKLNKELINYALNSIQTSGIFKGSRITQQEVQLMKNEANPSTEMTRKAVRQLLLEARTNQEYALHRNDAFAKYNALDGDPNQFESWYSKHWPRNTFQGSPAPGSGVAARVQTDADYARLPSGAEYITPDGVRRRKR